MTLITFKTVNGTTVAWTGRLSSILPSIIVIFEGLVGMVTIENRSFIMNNIKYV